MKCHVLTVARQFPKTHPRAGEETAFAMKILAKVKLHTVRKNFPFWERRIKQVQNGEAYLSIRQWIGEPYKQPGQEELFRLDASHGVSIQAIKYGYTPLREIPGLKVSNMDGCKNIFPVGITTIAHNDGLLPEDFDNWFGGVESMKDWHALIHFTNFRYHEQA